MKRANTMLLVLLFSLLLCACSSADQSAEQTVSGDNAAVTGEPAASSLETYESAEAVLAVDLDIKNAETVILADSTFGPYVLDVHQNDAFVKELMDKLNGEYVFVERAVDGEPRSGGGPSVIKFHDKDDQFLCGIRFGRQLPEDSWLMFVRRENAWDKYQEKTGRSIFPNCGLTLKNTAHRLKEQEPLIS